MRLARVFLAILLLAAGLYGQRFPAPGKPLAAISDGNPYLVRAFPAPGAGMPAPGSGMAYAAAAMKLKDETADQDARFAPVFEVVNQFVADKAFPGAVLAVGYQGSLVALKAFGKFDYSDKAQPVTTSAIYDLASVTKVVGTISGAAILFERKRLRLDVPVIRYLRHFAGPYQHDIITVRQLLMHDSGLPPFERFYLNYSGRRQILAQVFQTPLAAAPGVKAVYSDLGIILLGEIIERITGQRLNKFLQKQVFGPLKMKDTLYNPGRKLLKRIPPTENDPWRQRVVRGQVHDENCYAYGGICGHAGLFSTATDLAVFAQMMLNGGSYGGKRILDPETVDYFTTRQNEPPGTTRALGWDTPSERNSWAGQYFSPRSFIHTGFTGTSIAIDPDKQLFVILLTNRVNPTRDNNRISKARPAIHDAVVEALHCN
jgi:CubicO group peptidase (beta-lactamase class C family)